MSEGVPPGPGPEPGPGPAPGPDVPPLDIMLATSPGATAGMLPPGMEQANDLNFPPLGDETGPPEQSPHAPPPDDFDVAAPPGGWAEQTRVVMQEQRVLSAFSGGPQPAPEPEPELAPIVAGAAAPGQVWAEFTDPEPLGLGFDYRDIGMGQPAVVVTEVQRGKQASRNPQIRTGMMVSEVTAGDRPVVTAQSGGLTQDRMASLFQERPLKLLLEPAPAEATPGQGQQPRADPLLRQDSWQEEPISTVDGHPATAAEAWGGETPPPQQQQRGRNVTFQKSATPSAPQAQQMQAQQMQPSQSMSQLIMEVGPLEHTEEAEAILKLIVERTQKASRTKYRLINTEVPDELSRRHPPLKKGVILYSVKHAPDETPLRVVDMETQAYNDFVKQRPLWLLFVRKTSDVAKVAKLVMQEKRVLSAFGTGRPSARDRLKRMDPSLGQRGGGAATEQMQAEIAQLRKELQETKASEDALHKNLITLTEQHRQQVEKLEAEKELMDVAQFELKDQIADCRLEVKASLERERRLKVKGEQVKFVNKELRQRLEQLADHYDATVAQHEVALDAQSDALRRERDAHELCRAELRTHEVELGKALSELGVHRAHTEVTGTSAPAHVFQAGFVRQGGASQRRTAPARQAASPRASPRASQAASASLGLAGLAGARASGAEWAASAPAGTDAAAVRARAPTFVCLRLLTLVAMHCALADLVAAGAPRCKRTTHQLWLASKHHLAARWRHARAHFGGVKQ